ncbi:hypothetical protein JCM8097_004944 [Rhodosporidiobolus ruineniae]
MSFIPREQRAKPNTIALFDVDVPLTPARRPISPETVAALKALRQKINIGFVGGSDFAKISEQLAPDGHDVTQDFDFCFAENGLVGYKLGEKLPSESYIAYLGEERHKKLVKFVLHYIADLDIPVKRGTFIEFRNGLINLDERLAFNAYDKEHKVRQKFVDVLKKEFSDYGLRFSIGGQISFDAFPEGWDKTYALGRIADEGFDEIHFFGDSTAPGGNDYEIYEDPRTIGHTVTSPEDTIRQLKEIFGI